MLSDVPRTPDRAPDAGRAIAAIATRLSEAELRIALALAATANSAAVSIASCDDLVKQTRLTRSGVYKALAALVAGNWIAKRPGTATKKTAYLVNFLLTTTISAPEVVHPGGPLASRGVHPGGQNRPETVHPGGLVHPGVLPTVHPGVLPSHTIDDAGARVDSDRSILRSIDAKEQAEEAERIRQANAAEQTIASAQGDIFHRIATAKQADFPASTFDLARKWLHGYAAQFAGTTLNAYGQRIKRQPNPHPPDDGIVCQFLAIAEWQRLEAMLIQLSHEEQEAGEKYSWFLTVALQRIHGIAPEQQRRRRAELRIMTRRTRPDELSRECDTRNNLDNVAAAEQPPPAIEPAEKQRQNVPPCPTTEADASNSRAASEPPAAGDAPRPASRPTPPEAAWGPAAATPRPPHTAADAPVQPPEPRDPDAHAREPPPGTSELKRAIANAAAAKGWPWNG